MHRNGIVHRDLKLENWLMQTPGDTTGVKLIDFGLSKHFAQDQNMQQAVGSTYYVAPGKTNEWLVFAYLCHFVRFKVSGGTMHFVAPWLTNRRSRVFCSFCKIYRRVARRTL